MRTVSFLEKLLGGEFFRKKTCGLCGVTGGNESRLKYEISCDKKKYSRRKGVNKLWKVKLNAIIKAASQTGLMEVAEAA